jgi:tetratricopeptide (TPR) repeat protein
MSIQSVLGKRPSSFTEDQPPAKEQKTNGTSEDSRAPSAFHRVVSSQIADKQEVTQLQQKVEKLETQMETLSKTVEGMKEIMDKFIQKQGEPTPAQQSNKTPTALIQTINPELSLQEKLMIGNQHFARNNYEGAMAYFRSADLAETHPDYGEVQYRLGCCYHRSKDYANARICLGRVPDSHRFSAGANYLLGKIDVDLKITTPNTIIVLSKVRIGHNLFSRAQYFLGLVYGQQKNYSKAIEHFDNVRPPIGVCLAPAYIDFCSAQICIANSYLMLKNYRDARKYIIQARKLLTQAEQSVISPQKLQELLERCSNIEGQLPPP